MARCNGILDGVGKERVERKKGLDPRSMSWPNERVSTVFSLEDKDD